jgi:UDP-N-acetylglucosamine 1-carboxyvinyltransferase
MARIYRIAGGNSLSGSIRIQGAKNSVLKLMAATLLASGKHRLSNVPRISDVYVMAEILSAIGAKVKWTGVNDLEIEVPEVDELRPDPPLELVSKIRASVVLLGALLARLNSVSLALPGGDDFGIRPIDIHADALAMLGAEVSVTGGFLRARARDGLQGTRLVLEFPSHTATDNAIMAAVLAPGVTVIENAAREPEVVDLAAALTQMGAKISGAGTSRVVIEGVEKLAPMDHKVVPDRVVAATYLASVAMTGGELRLEDVRPDLMEILIRKLRLAGMLIDCFPNALEASAPPRPKAVDIQTLPYPGVATDYKPMLVAMLSRADGVSVVSENLFSGRFRYLEELRKFGANLISEGHHIVIRGVPSLAGARVQAHDIRAGAALVVAALGAGDESTISGIEHIERGYDSLPERLSRVGAKIVVDYEQ